MPNTWVWGIWSFLIYRKNMTSTRNFTYFSVHLLCYFTAGVLHKSFLLFRFSSRSLLSESFNNSLIDKIPGRQTDRKTLLGELNWIFTAVTDTIAWNVLPHGNKKTSSSRQLLDLFNFMITDLTACSITSFSHDHLLISQIYSSGCSGKIFQLLVFSGISYQLKGSCAQQIVLQFHIQCCHPLICIICGSLICFCLRITDTAIFVC